MRLSIWAKRARAVKTNRTHERDHRRAVLDSRMVAASRDGALDAVRMIPIKDAAAQTGYSRQYIFAEVKRGNIPGARQAYGRTWLIPMRWINERLKRKERNGR